MFPTADAPPNAILGAEIPGIAMSAMRDAREVNPLMTEVVMDLLSASWFACSLLLTIGTVTETVTSLVYRIRLFV